MPFAPPQNLTAEAVAALPPPGKLEPGQSGPSPFFPTSFPHYPLHQAYPVRQQSNLVPGTYTMMANPNF